MVLKNLPANCTAVGVPAAVVRINNKAINPADDLDQQDLPDLMAQDVYKRQLLAGIIMGLASAGLLGALSGLFAV